MSSDLSAIAEEEERNNFLFFGFIQSETAYFSLINF